MEESISIQRGGGGLTEELCKSDTHKKVSNIPLDNTSTHRSVSSLNPLYTGNFETGTLANSKDTSSGSVLFAKIKPIFRD